MGSGALGAALTSSPDGGRCPWAPAGLALRSALPPGLSGMAAAGGPRPDRRASPSVRGRLALRLGVAASAWLPCAVAVVLAFASAAYGAAAAVPVAVGGLVRVCWSGP